MQCFYCKIFLGQFNVPPIIARSCSKQSSIKADCIIYNQQSYLKQHLKYILIENNFSTSISECLGRTYLNNLMTLLSFLFFLSSLSFSFLSLSFPQSPAFFFWLLCISRKDQSHHGNIWVATILLILINIIIILYITNVISKVVKQQKSLFIRQFHNMP